MNTSIETESTLRELLAEFADDRAECWRFWTGEWDTIGDIALYLEEGPLADPSYEPYLGYVDFLMWGRPDVLWPNGAWVPRTRFELVLDRV